MKDQSLLGKLWGEDILELKEVTIKEDLTWQLTPSDSVNHWYTTLRALSNPASILIIYFMISMTNIPLSREIF